MYSKGLQLLTRQLNQRTLLNPSLFQKSIIRPWGIHSLRFISRSPILFNNHQRPGNYKNNNSINDNKNGYEPLPTKEQLLAKANNFFRD